MDTQSHASKPAGTLAYLPVGLFGGVMGLSGLALAWRHAQLLFGAPSWVGDVLGALALLAFVVLAVAYGVKMVSAFAAVKAEFQHPVAGNLFGLVPISMLLLAILLAPLSLTAARIVWAIGATAMTLFAWLVVSRWLHLRQELVHATPAWIVPVVGLLDVPLAVPVLQWPEVHGMMMFGLAVGLFFAMPLFTLIMSRLLFQEPMPAVMQPTLLIMVAPFSVGFSAYVATTGQIDGMAQALYMLTLFIMAVLLARLRHLGNCPFRLSWWSVSFPLAASSVSTQRYAEHAQMALTTGIAAVLLAFATAVILGLLLRTLRGIARGELAALS